MLRQSLMSLCDTRSREGPSSCPSQSMKNRDRAVPTAQPIARECRNSRRRSLTAEILENARPAVRDRRYSAISSRLHSRFGPTFVVLPNLSAGLDSLQGSDRNLGAEPNRPIVGGCIRWLALGKGCLGEQPAWMSTPSDGRRTGAILPTANRACSLTTEEETRI
jgi:hypothetical protein